MTATMGHSGQTSMQISSIDTAVVVQQTLLELDRLRKQLRQPFSAKATVDAAITHVEAGLRARAKDLLMSAEPPGKPLSSTQPAPTVMFATPGRTRRPMPAKGPSVADRVAVFRANPIRHPQSDAARAYLQAKFGVPKPQQPPAEQLSVAQGASSSGVLVRGLSPAAATPFVLPRNLRDDPYADMPAEVMNMEIDKGLLHVVNRRMLPPKADLSPALLGDGGPISMGSAQLHPAQQQHVRPPPTSALEDALMAGPTFKLDLLTPVIKPEKPPTGAGPVHVLDLDSRRLDDAGHAHASSTDNPAGTGAGARGAAGDEPRQYDVLMDTFSLHEFMIRKGALISNTPEFESYRRTYDVLWPVIGPLIQQLEMLSKQYALPLVVVDGRSLADLAHGVMESGAPPQMQDLLVCVHNIQEVAGLLRQPGRRFLGDLGSHEAATAIQAMWRGYRVRTRYSRKGLAAAAIQGAWRMHRLRAQLGEQLAAARAVRASKYQELQKQLAQNWHRLAHTPHVVVHIPSMRRPQPATLMQRDALLVAEAAQLSRLVDLAEPLVTVLLLLPGPPNPDVVSYWDRILQVGGVEDGPSRYRMIWPENSARLPMHMSTAAMLMASPVTLKRLRSAVGGRLGYIVPGLPGDEEVDLAVSLGLPLLSAAPHVSRAMCFKSSARAIFHAAGVHTPPGLNMLPRRLVPPPPPRQGPNGMHPLTEHTDFEFTPDGEMVVSEKPPPPGPPTRTQYEMDEERLLLIIAEAAVRWPHMGQWVVKIDDEVGNGAGHATFRVSSIRGAVEVLSRTASEELGRSMLPASGRVPTPLTDEQQVAVYRLSQLLYRQLPDKLLIVNKEVYPGYRDYIAALASRGGVVEAVPATLLGSPSANLLVDPTGRVALLSSHEKILIAPFCSTGSTFPQSSVPPRALLDAATSVGVACFKAGIIGHLAVDFVTLLEGDRAASSAPSTSSLRLWAVDITPCPTASLMAFQLFDFLTVGKWDPMLGVYIVDGELDADEVGSVQASLRQVPVNRGSVEGTEYGDFATQMAFLRHVGLEAFTVDGGLGGRVPMPPTLADPALRGERPPTCDLPSGLPSPRGSSSLASSVPPAGGGTSGSERANTTGSPYGSTPSILAASPVGTAGDVPASAGHGGSLIADTHSQYQDDAGSFALGSTLITPISGTQRVFFSIDALTHPALAATPCARFFHSCWQDGLHFDVDTRTGVIFNLCDKFMAGTLGVLTVGLAPHEVMARMHAVIAFLVQREAEIKAQRAAGDPAMSSGPGPVSAVHSFRDLQALIKYMADKSAAIMAACASYSPSPVLV